MALLMFTCCIISQCAFLFPRNPNFVQESIRQTDERQKREAEVLTQLEQDLNDFSEYDLRRRNEESVFHRLEDEIRTASELHMAHSDSLGDTANRHLEKGHEQGHNYVNQIQNVNVNQNETNQQEINRDAQPSVASTVASHLNDPEHHLTGSVAASGHGQSDETFKIDEQLWPLFTSTDEPYIILKAYDGDLLKSGTGLRHRQCKFWNKFYQKLKNTTRKLIKHFTFNFTHWEF